MKLSVRAADLQAHLSRQLPGLPDLRPHGHLKQALTDRSRTKGLFCEAEGGVPNGELFDVDETASASNEEGPWAL